MSNAAAIASGGRGNVTHGLALSFQVPVAKKALGVSITKAGIADAFLFVNR